MKMTILAMLFFQMIGSKPMLDNDYFRIFKNDAPCAAGLATCGERVFVALGSVELNGHKMERGDVQVFKAGQRYVPPKSGDYLEVEVKPGHPKVMPPSPGTPPPPGNKILYEGKDFTIFAEKMEPGETSSNHSHNTRLAIYLNKTQVQQWTNGKMEIRDLEPNVVVFRPPVVHISKDIGTVPISNILIEFKPK